MNSYNTCFQNKTRHHKPYGLLKQLLIPPQPWESISIDFIEHLSESNGYIDILVIIDKLTKQVISVPTHNLLDAASLTQLFIQNIFSKHRVPSHIILD